MYYKPLNYCSNRFSFAIRNRFPSVGMKWIICVEMQLNTIQSIVSSAIFWHDKFAIRNVNS